MSVPLLDLNAQHEPIRKDILAAIERVIDKNSYILGEEVKILEERVAAYCQARCGIGVSSGTDALLVSLMALGLGPDDEVITTPLSFFATAGCITRVGATPVFVDVEPDTLNLDPQKIQAAITPRTRAIVPVHLYGQCADMDPILEIAAEHELVVIEDAAQAIGAEYKDRRRAGSIGNIGCLSFFPSKNLGALGDGGMVVTNDEALADRVRLLRTQGGRPKYYHQAVGGNFRLDTLQASVLNVKLSYLDQWTSMRQQNAMRYEQLFTQYQLTGNDPVHLPPAVYRDSQVPHYHIYNQFIIRVPKRDALREFLKEQKIGAEIYYPVPLHLQECYASLGYVPGDLPQAEKACQENLGIPIYPELTLDQQETVVRAIAEFFDR
ncbi:DegT/DnrJ/EryC1/StrS family aminotransferase [Candidatus Nitrospira salsa]|nr:MAG: glutamine--scyllo-inositol aminotransferase [Nitrospirales bacterium]